MTFNPEFHWQKQKREINMHRLIRLALISLFLIFACIFIVKRCHFVSYLNMGLDESIPKETKIILKIESADKIIYKNKYGLKAVDDIKSYLSKSFAKDKKDVNIFLSAYGKNVYWIEKDANTQALLFNYSNLSLLKKKFKHNEIEKFNDKVIYEISDFPENNILPTKDKKIFVVYPGAYSVFVSNNMDYLKSIIQQNKLNYKIDLKKSSQIVSDNYLNSKSSISIRINDYRDIAGSNSWIYKFAPTINNLYLGNNKDLFFNIDFQDDSIKFAFSNKDEKRYFVFGDNVNSKDIVFYYNNVGLKNDKEIFINDSFEKFIGSKIEIPYNINLRKEFSSTSNLFASAFYNNGDIVVVSYDLEKLDYLYQSILSKFNPQKRSMKLPDGTSATEFYANPKSITLTTKEESSIKWRTYNQDGGFFLGQCNDYAVLSNKKERVTYFCGNKEDANKFLLRNSNTTESFLINVSNKKEYFNFLNSFSNKYNTLYGVNYSKDAYLNGYFELRE